ncbi:MAG: hypothetical protein QGG33_05130, partial [Candidatus Krumholzibacteria bacterium]|nr:hypothetical protein [Candidatus Krumholzibacteria bacterium]
RRGGLLEENRRSRPSLDSSVSPASSLPRLFPVPASRAGEISLALGHSRALLLLVEGSPEVYLGAKSTLLHYRKTGRPDCPLFSLSKRFQEEGRELSLEFVRAGLRKEWAEALEIRGILPLGDSRLSYSSLLLRGTLPEESTGMGLLSLGSGLESKVHLRIRTAFIKGTLALRYREGAGLGLGKRRLEACAGTRIQATRFSLRLLREREEEDQSGLAAFPRVEILESLDWEFQCRTQSRGLRLRGRRGFESPSVLLSFDGKESVAGLDYGLIFYSNAEGVPDFRSLEGAPLLPRPIMLRGRGARLSLKTQHSLRRWQLRSALALDTEFRFSFTLLLQSKSRDDGASRN